MIYIFVEIFSGALRGIGDVLIPVCITMSGVLIIRLSWILFVTPMTGERRLCCTAILWPGVLLCFCWRLTTGEGRNGFWQECPQPGIKNDPA